MKLKKEFIAYASDGDSYLVPAGEAAFSGMVKGNATLGAILDALKTETDENGVVNALCERFNGSREQISEDVRSALSVLGSIGALEE